MKERLMDGAPSGSQGSCTDNGWVNGPTFLPWLKHFVETVRLTKEKSVCCFSTTMKNKFFPALEYASQNNVIFLSFAPHTTNKMQPLDVSVYGPIKKFLEQELNTFKKITSATFHTCLFEELQPKMQLVGLAKQAYFHSIRTFSETQILLQRH
ncbi:hypothetical protein NQ318_016051 [Aromia moschata]|uniref:DDE-1 domain-containing protein n=1 Tax=Aromia moschata TaxID=1265417 RepID=A0AAV8Y2F2_9CUCU|nr:hypothetical protein NQ318_016051 [Aromia moschata]